jgi:predicted deacylase
MDSGKLANDSLAGPPAAPLDPAALAGRFEASGARAGFRAERFGEISGWPLIALTKPAAGPLPRIYLSSGIHGDEPAPPLALLSMIESGILDGRAAWFLCPLLNPAGLARGTRENADGLDLNRGYRDVQAREIQAHIAWLRRQSDFDLTVCMHEDWEAKGFYLYELNPDLRPSFAEAMIAAVLPICPIDASAIIDGRPASGGVIRPSADPLLREKWPESIYLRAHHNAKFHFTIESPSSFPLEQRMAALRAATETAIGLFCA